jgi:hypothetical protein
MASGLRPYGIDRDKPCKLIDAQEIAADRAADRHVRCHSPCGCLNVAGPRRSKSPEAEAFARAVIRAVSLQESRDTASTGTT